MPLRKGGWSLVELLVVLAVMAVLGVILAMRFSGTGAGVESEAALMRANLRFAQSLAMANNTHSWSVQFAGGWYELRRDGASSPITMPGENGPRRNLPDGLAITSGAGTLTFDDRGSPGSSDYVVVLNGVKQVLITATTGFIP
jgi:prepilin-type N-terminal cleavage/methylation domain-containing protein